MSKRKLTKRQKWCIEKIQQEKIARLQKKEALFWNNNDFSPEQEGLIISNYGSQIDVEPLYEKGICYRCHLRQNLPPLVTGDRVVWHAGKNDQTGIVVALCERHNLLSRPNNFGEIKPVAANINRIFVTISVLPDISTNLIDRYLVIAELASIEPVIIFNKIDLLDELDLIKVNEIKHFYEGLGYKVFMLSAQTQEGLAQIKTLLNDSKSIFVGQSGVGKSSLVNALIPDINTLIGELSHATGKGMHTTSVTRLFHIPTGGALIDSPGIREFGLWHIDSEDVIYGFREFRTFLGRCKFSNCRHQKEIGCAILDAEEKGLINQNRVDSYRKILASNAEEK